MIYPDRNEFMRQAREADLIPVYTEIMADLETPVSAFMKLSDNSHAYLLESVEGGTRMGRYSFLGFAPERVVTIRGDRGVVTGRNGETEELDDAVGLRDLETPRAGELDLLPGHASILEGEVRGLHPHLER